MAKINHYRMLNKWHQTITFQVELLLQELDTLQVEQNLCQERLKMGQATQQVEHLHLGQARAR
jgi:hypothetical protein